MHAISSYRGNRPTNTHTHTHTHKPTDSTNYTTVRAKLSAQCNKSKHVPIRRKRLFGLGSDLFSIISFWNGMVVIGTST